MNFSSRATSRPGRIVCPACGSGELRFRGPTLLQFRRPALAECDSCGRNVDGAVLRVLEQIVALPDAIGDHTCDCGHPKMRKLPDRVFHCPACGSEVLPLKAFTTVSGTRSAGSPIGSLTSHPWNSFSTRPGITSRKQKGGERDEGLEEI